MIILPLVEPIETTNYGSYLKLNVDDIEYITFFYIPTFSRVAIDDKEMIYEFVEKLNKCRVNMKPKRDIAIGYIYSATIYFKDGTHDLIELNNLVSINQRQHEIIDERISELWLDEFLKDSWIDER